jgi:hypothetical protein
MLRGSKEAVPSLSPPPLDRPLTRIAVGGFGDGWNAYPHSMAWFKWALYVGTTRANLCSIKAARPPGFVFWPIKCPDDVYDIDRRAEIWRFDPEVGSWERVYTSPWADDAGRVPRDIGYRGMRVFRGLSDADEALYVLTWSPSKSGKPSIMLRTTDGRQFVPTKPHESDASVTTYRALCVFNGRLFTSPAGRTAGWKGGKHQGVEDCAVGQAVVLENAEPLNRSWKLANIPSFGPYLPWDKFPPELALACRYLSLEDLAARHSGCELWRSQDGVTWQPVTQDGFGSGYNFGIRRLASTPRGLFVGTANPFGPEVAYTDERGNWNYRPNPRGGLEIWWLPRGRENTPSE